MQAHTVIEPYTVVVKLLNTHIAHRTMFRSCGLIHFTSLTPVFLLKYDFVVVESLDACLKVILSHVSWANETSHEISKIAKYHDEGPDVFVVLINVGIGHMVEAVKNVNVKAAKSASEVY